MFKEQVETNGTSDMRGVDVFIDSINRMIMDDDVGRFSIFVFEIINLSQINRDLDYGYGRECVLNVRETAGEVFNGCDIIPIYLNKTAVILDDMKMGDVEKIGKIFLNHFADPVMIRDLPIQLRINGGIVSYPVHGVEPDGLFIKLGKSLAQCQEDMGDISIFDEDKSRQVSSRYMRRKLLYNAIVNDELRLEYQPQYCSESQTIIGAEALLRWDDSQMQIDQVISFAEETELINQLTKWVISKAIDNLSNWRGKGLWTSISINISLKDLMNDYFIMHLNSEIERASLESGQLVIEIAENGVHGNEKRIIDQLNPIRRKGVRVAVDDYFMRYVETGERPIRFFDIIKIDKSLVERIEDPKGYAEINRIIRTAKEWDLGVIAVGVETETQYMILTEMGCDVIQGYYISKPVEPSEYETLI